MDTLRGFVDAVWVTDSSLRNSDKVPSQVWSKPDGISGDFELRRLTTAENREGRRTDFFEFYWAHMMEGTQVGHLLAWARLLIFRSPARVLEQLRGVWYFLVGVTVAVLLAFIAFWIWGDNLAGWVKPTVTAVGTALWALVGAFVVKKVVGDAARYLHVAPTNIESRHRIREAGIKLLDTLHKSGSYDRIIVVGHSLGTVIGYDILTHYWAKCNDVFDPVAKPQVIQLERLEQLARNPNGSDFAPRYQAVQSEYWSELRASKNPWLVTDFVTMGSPLAHAVLLLARTENEFIRKKDEREFPTCPPTLEDVLVAPKQRQERFSFERDGHWVPHHGAVFAPTRWTNLYFPCHATIWGDLIGGPMVPAFGPGILDLRVTTRLQRGLFTHTLYWKLPKSCPGGSELDSIKNLRAAMRICMAPPRPARPVKSIPSATENPPGAEVT